MVLQGCGKLSNYKNTLCQFKGWSYGLAGLWQVVDL